MPEILMPDGVLVNFPDTMSKEEIRRIAQQKFPELFTPEEPEGSEFTRGVQRGAETVKALIQEGVPAVAEGVVNRGFQAFGYDDPFDTYDNLKRYQEKVQKAYEDYPTSVPSFKDISNLEDVGAYVASAAGEQVPQLGLSLLTGGIGGFGTKAIVQQLAKRGGKALTEAQAKKVLNRGIIGGTAVSSGAQNIPESYFNLLEKGEDDVVSSVVVGGLKTALDTLPQIEILKKVLGPNASDIVADTFVKRIAREGGKTAVKEGLTETAQESLDVIAEQFILDNADSIFSEENINRLIDSGLKGAIGGGIAGGAVGGLGGTTIINPDERPPSIDVEKAFEEEVIGIDDSIVEPTYLPENILDVASDYGIKKESLTNVDPTNLDTFSTYFTKINNEANSLGDVFNPTIEDNVNVTEELIARKETIENDERTDAEFIVGDGEIVFGVPINTREQDPNTILSSLEVVGQQDLEKKTLPERKRKPKVVPPTETTNTVSSKLPSNLRYAKPRYKKSKLSFPSDVERALYITASDSKTKSKRHDEYVKWLKDYTGLSNSEINVLGNDLRNTIKEISNKLPKDEDTIIVPKVDLGFDVKPQKLNLPSYGNMRDDYVIPKVIANNLQGIELTPEGAKQYKSLINQLERIVKQVGGDKVNVKPFSRLEDNFTGEPIAGAKFLSTVALALNDVTEVQIEETAYHEAWHFVEDNGMFSEKELQVIDNNTPLLIKYLNEDDYLRNSDFEGLLSTPQGRSELRANAFGKWVKSKQTKNLPNKFKQVFKKIKNFIERLGNAYKGLGFTSVEDIFNSALEGKRTVDIIDEINYTNKIARYQRISDEYKEVINKDNQEYAEGTKYKDLIKQARYDTNKESKTGIGPIGMFGKWVNSFKWLASKYPMAGQVMASLERQMSNNSAYLNGYKNALGDFTQLDKEVRYKIFDLANYLRNTGQQATLDSEGKLTFKRDGKIVRLNDVNVSKSYMDLQNAFKLSLQDVENFFKNKAAIEFKISPEDVTVDNVNLLLSDETISEGKRKRLENLKDFLTQLNAVKSVDYIPHSFFGNYGITVRDRETDEQVAFFTFEKGTYKKFYNKYQMELAFKEIKEKGYNDNSKYKIIGGNGTIKNLDSLDKIEPFRLTYNELKNKVDSRLLNVEMLSSLINSGDQNQEAFGKLRDEIFNDLLTKGFKNRFTKASNIEGYSKDWDRVIHSYLSGNAHWLSGLQFQDELAVMQPEIDSLHDKGLRDKLNSHIEYVTSPQEDFVRMRSVNFIWAMGGNLSTAALQLMTLPVFTLGELTKVNPNVVSNMDSIRKWTQIGIQNFIPESTKTFYTSNGSLFLHFDNEDITRPLVEKGVLTQKHVEFQKKLAERDKVRGFAVEEYTGYTPFESRSLGGSVKAKLSKTANMLGMPISIMEQLTRYGSVMSIYDTLISNPKAIDNALRAYKNDQRLQAILNSKSPFTTEEKLALFMMDNVHGIFGKIGRSEIFKGIGGALILPFQTYPQQMLEGLIDAGIYQGKEGRRGLAVTVGSLMLFSGLLGLPGFELLKELLEEIEKNITGSEEDLDLVIREKIYDLTGDVRFAKAITQGIGRGYWGLDISRRVGLPIVGQDIILNVTGIRGDSSDILGVQGSIISGIGQAWNEYNTDGSTASIMSSLTPVAASNLIKAYAMGTEGVKTRRGIQLVTPEEITTKTRLAKVLGITSDQVATKREEQYAKILVEGKYRTGIDRQRTKAKRVLTDLYKARQRKDWDEVKKQQEKYSDILKDLSEYAIKNNIPLDLKAFNRSVKKAAQQRITAKINLKDVRKIGREDLQRIQKVLGVE